MRASRRSARAAWTLALALFAGAAFAGRDVESRAPACAEPREAASRDGHSVRVVCDAGGGGPLRGPARLLFGLRLDPNRADPRALEVLPGIGPARAEAIAAERARRPFASVDDLGRVPGIGPVTLRRARPWLDVGVSAAPAPAAARR